MNLFTLLLSVTLGLGVGFGLAFLICASLLKKSNNIGDSIGNIRDYSDTGVQFSVSTKRLKRDERDTFTQTYERIPVSEFAEPANNEPVHKLLKRK